MERPFRWAPPPLDDHVFLRARLIDRLRQRWLMPLTTVVAGAGYGKSTVLAQAVEENALDPRGTDVWLTCEPGDSAGSRMLEALGRVIPGADRHPTPDDVDALADRLWSVAPGDVTVILDDVHLLEPGSRGERLVGELVATLPQNAHVVLSSRHEPAVPTARLRAQGQLATVTEHDLRLTDDELAELARRRGVGVEVLEGAGGWPALAELHASAGRGAARQFLAEEVLERLPSVSRRALEAAVVVGDATSRLLVELVGAEVDLYVLAQLPSVTVSDDGTVRPHQLWEEPVLSAIGPERLADLRRRAASFLTDDDQPDRAFELLVVADVWPEAGEALFAACNHQEHPPRPDVMARWRSMVPAERDSEPAVLYLEALVHRAEDPWSDHGWGRFEDAIDRYRADGDLPREIAGSVRASYTAWTRADVTGLTVLRRRVEAWPKGVPDVDLLLGLNAASIAAASGASDTVLELLDDLDPRRFEPRLRFFLPLMRAEALLTAGRASEAVGPADQAAQWAQACPHAAGTAIAAVRPLVARLAAGEGDVLAGSAPRPDDVVGGLDEQLETLGWWAVTAAHRHDLRPARALLDRFDAICPPGARSGRPAGVRLVAAVSLLVAEDREEEATGAVESFIECHAFERGRTWRAVLWFPTVVAAVHPRAAELLSGADVGPRPRRSLAIAAIRHRASDQEPGGPDVPWSDVDELLCAVPLPLAVELVVRAMATGTDDRLGDLRQIAEIDPNSARTTLRRLASISDEPVATTAQQTLSVLPLPPSAPVRIDLLGPLRLCRGDVDVDDPDWRRLKVRQLLLLLAIRRQVRRGLVGALIWPEMDEEAAGRNLRLTLHYLQRLLEPDRESGDAPFLLRQDGGVLRLSAGAHLTVDAWECERMIDEADDAVARGTPSVALPLLEAAVAMWRGDCLADAIDQPWAEEEARRLTARLVAASARAGELLVATGRSSDAVRIAGRALRSEPWSERLHRVQIAAHLAAGDRAAARRTLDACHLMLDDLGASPGPELASLAERVATGR